MGKDRSSIRDAASPHPSPRGRRSSRRTPSPSQGFACVPGVVLTRSASELAASAATESRVLETAALLATAAVMPTPGMATVVAQQGREGDQQGHAQAPIQLPFHPEGFIPAICRPKIELPEAAADTAIPGAAQSPATVLSTRPPVLLSKLPPLQESEKDHFNLAFEVPAEAPAESANRDSQPGASAGTDQIYLHSSVVSQAEKEYGADALSEIGMVLDGIFAADAIQSEEARHMWDDQLQALKTNPMLFRFYEKRDPLYLPDGTIDRAKLPPHMTVIRLSSIGELPIPKARASLVTKIQNYWESRKSELAAPQDVRYLRGRFDVSQTKATAVLAAIRYGMKRVVGEEKRVTPDYAYKLQSEQAFVGQPVLLPESKIQLSVLKYSQPSEFSRILNCVNTSASPTSIAPREIVQQILNNVCLFTSSDGSLSRRPVQRIMADGTTVELSPADEITVEKELETILKSETRTRNLLPSAMKLKSE